MSKGKWKKNVASADGGRIASAVVGANAVAERFDEGPKVDDNFLGEMSDLLETPFYSIHYGIPQFRQELVSPDARHWVVKWFFPNAEGGPVYVDYPRNKAEMAICEKKAAIMKRLKLKYKLFRPEEEHKLQVAMSVVEPEAEIPAGESF